MALQGPGQQPGAPFFLRTTALSADPNNQYRTTRRELIFDDEFRRANGVLGAPDWKNFNGTPGTSLNIVAPGILTPGLDQGSSTDIAVVPAGGTYPSDQWAEMKLLTSYGGGTLDRGPGLILRASDTVNSYYGVTFRAGNSLMTFVLRSGGPIVESFAYRTTFTVGDTLRFEAQGTTLRVIRNGALVLQWSQLSNTLTDGRPGMVFLSPSSTGSAAPFFGAFAAGGFAPLGTTATVGFAERDRFGPGKQPSARFMFQTSARGITPPLDIGTPKPPLEWNSGPGTQPRKRLMFQSSARSTEVFDPYAGTRRELIADDFFARPDGGLGRISNQVGTGVGLNGSGWLTPPGNNDFYVAGRKARPSKTGNDNRAYYGAIAWPADQWSEALIESANIGSSGNAGFGVHVRSSLTATTGADLIIQHDLSLCRIQIVVANVFVATYNFRATWAAGDWARLEVQGQRYTVYRNNVFVFRAVDNAALLTGGVPGITFSSTLSNPVKAILAWAGGGFGSALTTATDGIDSLSRRGPGIQPSARFMLQTSPRGITPPLDIGTPKEPLDWRAGPGIQPRKRFMFKTSPRDTSTPTVTLGAMEGVSLGDLIATIGDLKASGALEGVSLGELISTVGGMIATGALAGVSLGQIDSTIGSLLAAAAAALSGATSTGFTSVGALTGAGALAGDAITTLTPTGSLVGAGALAGTALPAAEATGALLGAGAVAGVSIVVRTPTGAVVGAGIVSGVAATHATGLGSLAGAGAVAGASLGLIDTTVGSLVGAGALGGTSIPGITVTGALLALSSGAISGVAFVATTGTGAMVASGTLAGEAAAVSTALGSMLGAGALGGISLTDAKTVAALGGTGAVSGVSLGLIDTATGSMRGAGALSGGSFSLWLPTGSLLGSSPSAIFGVSLLTFQTVGALTGSSPGQLFGTAALSTVALGSAVDGIAFSYRIDPCYTISLAARKFSVSLPVRAFTVSQSARPFTVTIKGRTFTVALDARGFTVKGTC